MSQENLKNYSELFKRNQNIISLETQNKISTLKVLIAGCGSVGGAFIEGASRLGVLNYKLTEPDEYDLNNLNRQFVYPSDIGKNKAIVHAERLKSLFANCNVKTEVDTGGINSDNVDSLTSDIDVIFDAVDVTTKNGMSAKLLLHESASLKKVPVFSSLDLGFKQWIHFYDYRSITLPLDGRMDLAKNCKNPLKALIQGFCSAEELSMEVLEEVIKLLTVPESNACQLASCCHLLAAFTGPLIIRFCENKKIAPIVSCDLMRILEDQHETKLTEEKRLILLSKLQELLAIIT
jgi:molybdopterin/thiamine biosynthesis adenylyltransferase